MDPIKIEKLEAMCKYKKNQFFINFTLHYFIALICMLFCSSPFWFPSLYSSMQVFIFISLPNIGSFICSPKCLFIVCNVIIVFLVGESKFVGSHSSPATDIYDDYVRRSQSLRRPSVNEENKVEKKIEMTRIEESGKEVQEDVDEVKEEKGEEEEEKKEKEEDVDGEEELSLPTEELNKRVEDFIARMNKQRRLEAKLMAS